MPALDWANRIMWTGDNLDIKATVSTNSFREALGYRKAKRWKV